MLIDLRDYQRAAFDAAREFIRQGKRRVLINAPTGSGKCLGRGTPVLMFDGEVKPVEQVVAGDLLMGPDSTPRRVLTTAAGVGPLYRVTPSKGDAYVVNDAHILSLKITRGATKWDCSRSDQYRAGKVHNLTVTDYLSRSATFRHCAKGWRTGVDFAGGQPLPLSPYFLGVWLGDGLSNKASVCTADAEIADEVEAIATQFGLQVRIERQDGNRSVVLHIHGGRRGGAAHPIKDLLDSLGVLSNKHIPRSYLTASREDRLQLLAGLIDTDGSASGGGFDFVQKNERLARDVAFLARSLGLAAYLTPCRKTCSNNGVAGDYWRLSISGDCTIVPVRLPRRRPLARAIKKDPLLVGLKVEPIGSGEYFGFEIDGDRLFLLGDFTVTHNTVLASALMEMVREKGNRANFVVDRLSLIQQTSDTFFRYGLDHGVVQSSHPLYRPSLGIQLCSVQTLSRRGWPESHVDVFDEAHVLHATHKARIEHGGSIVIGLTATPFTKGLGKYFDAVVNVTTTRKLIEDGWLAPYRIFSCAEPDMTGVAVKSTGEWDDTQASKKALEVVGDVVQEYLKHGDGRKFICSAVDTVHVEELQRQFLSAGINVATYTYKDKEDDRAETTAEFRKPGSLIRGLITVTAASRGFDVPDVSCVIMARPLRKSLAEHIQLFGRGLRIAEGKTDCLARGTLVLTDCGEIPIEHITLDHKVWDGENFVSHAGAVCRGMREVIEYDGLIATPDHRVMTDDGWTRFEEAARGQRRIARTGIAGRAVRLADDRQQRGAWGFGQVAGIGSVRSVFRRAFGAFPQLAKARGYGCGLSALQWAPASAGAAVAVSAMPSANGPLPQSELRIVGALRSAWNRVQVFLGERGCSLGGGEPWGSGSGDAVGPHQQQRPLRTWKSSLDNAGWEPEQHAGIWRPGEVHCLPQGIPGCALRGCDVDAHVEHDDTRGDCGSLEGTLTQAQREVWDVLNAGPLQRFTADGRLVHNCLVLDHSGNCARFFADCEDFFDNGIDGLDDGKPKEKKKAEKAEVEPVKCPSCRALHRPSPFCPVCGHEYPKRAAVQHVPGTLKELIAGGHHRELTRNLWPQVMAYCLERREGDAARRQALAIYRDMTGDWPRAKWENTQPADDISAEVRNRIRAQQIGFAKRRESGRAAA
jgi:superfamily II DNA or RNA helicase